MRLAHRPAELLAADADARRAAVVGDRHPAEVGRSAGSSGRISTPTLRGVVRSRCRSRCSRRCASGSAYSTVGLRHQAAAQRVDHVGRWRRCSSSANKRMAQRAARRLGPAPGSRSASAARRPCAACAARPLQAARRVPARPGRSPGRRWRRRRERPRSLPLRRNTANGRFWIGKSLPAALAEASQLRASASWVWLSCIMVIQAGAVSRVVEDRHRAGPAGRGAADLVRETRDEEAARRQHFEVVQLLEVAVADVAPGLVAFPDQRRRRGSRRISCAVCTKGASQLQASVPVRRTPRSSRYMVAS